MNLHKPKLHLCTGTLLLSVCAVSSVGAAQAAPAPKSTATTGRSVARSSARKPRVTSSTRARSSRRHRALTAKQIRARLKPAPERIEQIQEALAREGYLSGEPNGKWDDRTREAMRRYQAANGFPTTGLPEAKSLMKLGLGPHPLPMTLDHSSHAKLDEQPAAPDVAADPTEVGARKDLGPGSAVPPSPQP